MKSILEFLRDELNKYKNSIQLVSGIITVIIGLSTLLVKVFDSKYNIALICIGLFFIVKKIASEIIEAKKRIVWSNYK